MATDSYTLEELVIWCLARRFRPADVLVVGVATPIATAAGHLARRLLVEDLIIFEAAAVDPAPHDIALGMVIPELLVEQSVGVLTQAEILDAVQRGRVTLQLISPAQVDGQGALNTSRVRAADGSFRRLPGSLATADIAGLVGRLIVYRLTHSPRFLPEQVDYVSGAPGRVEAIVTSRAVLERGPDGFRVASVHPGEDLETVQAGCGFELDVSGSVAITEPPPADALRLLREEIDPHGTRRLETREGREDALRVLAELSR
jgi:acyl CoA:acetate/3-ketoacid CoA transferase beta subunit